MIDGAGGTNSSTIMRDALEQQHSIKIVLQYVTYNEKGIRNLACGALCMVNITHTKSDQLSHKNVNTKHFKQDSVNKKAFCL